MRYVSKNILKKIYKRRDLWSHKGQFGKLLVIAGSKRHTGSPCFVGLSAYKAGCDLVYIAAPERPANIAANFSPNLITEPLRGDKLMKKHIDKIISLSREVRATAVAIGPGLWRDKKTFDSINELIKRIELPMVIDADAIRAVSKRKEILKDKKCVLTPHADEFKDLTGLEVKGFDMRLKAVKEEAKKLGIVIVLKGHIDVISDGKTLILNRTGSPYLTKGGCGDTLTGICGALLARGINPFTSACAATHINGMAGKLAARKYKQSLLATDLIENIYKIMLKNL